MNFFKRNWLTIVLLAALVFGCAWLFQFAYSHAGRVVPDAEATQLAIATATTEVDLTAVAKFQVGDSAVVFAGTYGALVPLFSGPGSRSFSSQIPNTSAVTILSIGIDDNQVIWYEVQALAGVGWLKEENLVEP